MERIKNRRAESLVFGGLITTFSIENWASGGMAYTIDLKSIGRKAVRVRLPPCPLNLGLIAQHLQKPQVLLGMQEKHPSSLV